MEAACRLRRGLGGTVLNAPSLNLLRYPSRLRMPDAVVWRHALWPLLAGLVAGLALVFWQARWHARLLDERGALQASLQLQQRQQAELREAQALAQSQARMRERASAWQLQRQQFMQLHTQLSQEADGAGLRLQRWRADGHKLSLQLWLPHPEGVPGLVARLSQASPQPWTLHSLAGQSDPPGVEAVLETVWPSSPTGGRKP